MSKCFTPFNKTGNTTTIQKWLEEQNFTLGDGWNKSISSKFVTVFHKNAGVGVLLQYIDTSNIELRYHSGFLYDFIDRGALIDLDTMTFVDKPHIKITGIIDISECIKCDC